MEVAAPEEPMVVDSAAAEAGQPATDSENEAATVAAPDMSSMNIDSTDEDDGDDIDFSSGGDNTEAKLLKALSFKDRGNDAIKNNEVEDAKRMYERGLKIVNTIYGEEQASGLKVMLSLNLALACTKLSQFGEAIRAADTALQLQPDNTKAMFRRGVARAAFGMLEEAKTDLAEVIKMDPKNAAARKELKAVKERLVEQKKASHLDKASFGGMFSKGGSIYDDKEEERKKRTAAEAERTAAELRDWQQSNEDRVAVGLGAQTREEWLKDRGDKGVVQEPPKLIPPKPPVKTPIPKPVPQPAPAVAPAAASEAGDDDHLDEEDLKIINETKKKGYCYFRRKLDDKEQAMLDEEQRKLREGGGGGALSPSVGGTSSTASPAPSLRKQLSAQEGAGAGSEWNAAGTWEETDRTQWAKAKLEALLLTAAVTTGPDLKNDPGALMREMTAAFSGGAGATAAAAGDLASLGAIGVKLATLRAHVYSCDKMEGDASVVCVRGRRRWLFDFSMTLKWRVTVDESMGVEQPADDAKPPSKTYKGTFKLVDVTAADAENGHFETKPEMKLAKSSTRWPEAYNTRMTEVLEALQRDMVAKVQAMYAEYQALP
ncbi:hypothetical protein JKP88DRAFT_266903 [Tribonema minus]|uniref:peptidylprolyl isomerase n=1 Tax=Tribonema minus TaxID=303371 RepID=A0A835ZA39_9STRA|nr:hypothetical protein JKP88DRAFT_266903 [Tribonema minus]